MPLMFIVSAVSATLSVVDQNGVAGELLTPSLFHLDQIKACHYGSSSIPAQHIIEPLNHNQASSVGELRLGPPYTLAPHFFRVFGRM